MLFITDRVVYNYVYMILYEGCLVLMNMLMKACVYMYMLNAYHVYTNINTHILLLFFYMKRSDKEDEMKAPVKAVFILYLFGYKRLHFPLFSGKQTQNQDLSY